MEYDLYSQLETFSTKLTMNAISFLMKSGELKRYKRGEVIAREGEDSEHVYIIIDGTAAVEKIDEMGNKSRLATVPAGSLIGEMGVFLERKRSATIVANSDMNLIKFTNQNFINALPKTPDLTLRLLRSLSDKINLINNKYTNALAANNMLSVGVYIISAAKGNDEVEVQLDTKVMISQTKINAHKIKSALQVFLSKNLISKWRFNENNCLVFKVHLPRLKDFLNGLAASE